MATVVSVKVNTLTGSVTFADDVKAADVLRRYYLYMQLGPADASPQAMLDAIAGSVANEIGRYAVQHFTDERRLQLESQLKAEAEAAVNFLGGIARVQSIKGG